MHDAVSVFHMKTDDESDRGDLHWNLGSGASQEGS